MNKETRIQKIQEIIARDRANPFGKIEIPWEDNLKVMDVFKIPLEYLVYNKYNGRILSRTQSLEKQNYVIDVESAEGKARIEDLLWKSNEQRNDSTLKSIRDYGQQKVGIITKDGIIIDGNRRAMLLNRGKKYDYFKAVVLDVTLEENPLEIEKLETTYQMGEDEKVGYNATEKYIKSKLLYKKLTQKIYSSNIDKHTPDKTAIDKISKWMGQDSSEVIKYLNTMEIMDDYLQYLDYDGMYTQLDKREDQFLNLTKWLDNFYDEKSRRAFDGYKNSDVDDLKLIAFDYIRIQYEGKEFRKIADGNKENHFFGDKEIWKNFSKIHFEKKNLIEETIIDLNSRDLKSHLDSRDSEFYEKSKLGKEKSFLVENLETHRTKLGNNQAAGQPIKLVEKSIDAINAIKTNHNSFAEPDVQEQLSELSKKVMSIQLKKSPARVLTQIINLIESIDLNKIPDNEKEEVSILAKQINKLTYNINRQL